MTRAPDLLPPAPPLDKSIGLLFFQAKEILFTKRLLNRYMSEYTDQPVDKIEVRYRCYRVDCLTFIPMGLEREKDHQGH